MAVRIFQKICSQWFRHKPKQKTVSETKDVVLEDGFSPMTYQNPFIYYMHEILDQIISKKNISFQKLELIIIDAEDFHDSDIDDVLFVLNDLSQELNYLLILSDRIDAYEKFSDQMYEENGLIVQKCTKSVQKKARGNLVLDFERSGKFCPQNVIYPETIYLPVYKKPWEISEKLDIIVPVGYNTLVVDGFFLPQPEECCSMNGRFMKDRINKTDRLDQEFRKG